MMPFGRVLTLLVAVTVVNALAGAIGEETGGVAWPRAALALVVCGELRQFESREVQLGLLHHAYLSQTLPVFAYLCTERAAEVDANVLLPLSARFVFDAPDRFSRRARCLDAVLAHAAAAGHAFSWFVFVRPDTVFSLPLPSALSLDASSVHARVRCSFTEAALSEDELSAWSPLSDEPERERGFSCCAPLLAPPPGLDASRTVFDDAAAFVPARHAVAYANFSLLFAASSPASLPRHAQHAFAEEAAFSSHLEARRVPVSVLRLRARPAGSKGAPQTRREGPSGFAPPRACPPPGARPAASDAQPRGGGATGVPRMEDVRAVGLEFSHLIQPPLYPHAVFMSAVRAPAALAGASSATEPVVFLAFHKVRPGAYESRVVLLDASLRFIADVGGQLERMDDPRCFVLKSSVYVVDNHMIEPREVLQLSSGVRTRLRHPFAVQGKNWTPLVHFGQLLFVFSLAPLCVIDCGALDTGDCVVLPSTAAGCDALGGAHAGVRRGGSSALLFGGRIAGLGHATLDGGHHEPFLWHFPASCLEETSALRDALVNCYAATFVDVDARFHAARFAHAPGTSGIHDPGALVVSRGALWAIITEADTSWRDSPAHNISVYRVVLTTKWEV